VSQRQDHLLHLRVLQLNSWKVFYETAEAYPS